MKLMFSQLSSYAIDRLIIVSLEQALYQALVEMDGEEYLVWENEEKPFQSRSMSQLREQFAVLEVAAIVLRHDSPYDEMVGQADKNYSNRMEVPLSVISNTNKSTLN